MQRRRRSSHLRIASGTDKGKKKTALLLLSCYQYYTPIFTINMLSRKISIPSSGLVSRSYTVNYHAVSFWIPRRAVLMAKSNASFRFLIYS